MIERDWIYGSMSSSFHLDFYAFLMRCWVPGPVLFHILTTGRRWCTRQNDDRTHAQCVFASLPACSLALRAVHALLLWLTDLQESCWTFVLPVRCHICALTNETTMSEILMKEMETISLSPVKERERPDGVSSFLLVDEQENLQVKLANVSWPSRC